MASVTAATIFEDTRKPLKLWLQAMWFVTGQKLGVSALGLQRVLGLRSYQTAWTWLHKLRRAMVRPEREKLRGHIEVDEFYLGGFHEGAAEARLGGRGSVKKVVVAVAVEKTDNHFGRIRLRQIYRADRPTLHRFVTDMIEKGSTIGTDGYQAYYGLEDLGYVHEATVMMGRRKSEPHVLMPYVHRVAGLFKRWWLGTHQGAVRAQHLEYYLDEFTFRFNRRTSRSRGLLFYRLVQQALMAEHTPYKQIVGGLPVQTGPKGPKRRVPHEERRKAPKIVNRPE